MKGHLKDLTRNMDGTWNLTVAVAGDLRAMWDKYRATDVDVEIKKYREKRSLDANGYMWVLVDKIAEKMHLGKAEVYRNAIKDIGGASTVVCVQDVAVDALCRGWQDRGLGWQTETTPSKIKGCKNVILYYGSSCYDTRQFSILLDHLIQDAQALGIETMTPAELAKIMELYEQKYHARHEGMLPDRERAMA